MLTIFVGCSDSHTVADSFDDRRIVLQEWSWHELRGQFDQQRVSKSDELLISALSKAYARDPYRKDLTRLSFRRILVTSSTSRRYFIFELDDVEDYQVVFEIDSDGALVDNFMMSSFLSPGVKN